MSRTLILNIRPWIDRLFMMLSRKMRIDGLWVGALGGEAELPVLVEALALIRTFDPVRYRRLRADLRRVWLTVLLGRIGEYSQATATCKIDSGYATSTSASVVALIIVHEATHARLRRFGYPEDRRHKLELACIRRERAFAKLLPDGDALVQWVEERLAKPADFSSANLEKQRREGEWKAAKEIGLPIWFVKAAHSYRDRRSA